MKIWDSIGYFKNDIYIVSNIILICALVGCTAIGIRCTRLWNYAELFWIMLLHLLSSTWK